MTNRISDLQARNAWAALQQIADAPHGCDTPVRCDYCRLVSIARLAVYGDARVPTKAEMGS